MGLLGGAIKLIIIPIIFVVAIAVLGGIYLKHRRNKAAAINDVEQPQFTAAHYPPPVSAAPPPVYAPSPVQYMGPAKPAPVATVQGYN
ncbi:hypothetical protein LEL_07009 [Akanthomyces lecanii RCEF 1005]|uniref:Uncharacterized protein n=1 Tax=Akanthomyces lecanii RCEF 1005 TaxID=1081108 RepID=A0A168FDB6_CORDF|nr:hypothetical protein LEL_07009 [Akanthomyces lecanii RCEF 1005]